MASAPDPERERLMLLRRKSYGQPGLAARVAEIDKRLAELDAANG